VVSSTLYEITEDVRALEELMVELGGDVTDEADLEAVESWFSSLNEGMSNKLDNYAALVKEVEARGNSRLEEAKRMKRLAEADLSLGKRLKERMMWALQLMGHRRVDTDRFRVTVAKNGGKLPLVLDDNVPDEFMKTVEVTAPDSEKIRAVLAEGSSLGFAHLGDRGQTLRIG
tara:strand:- start:62 stop:580 length:519 start_codon:yes stop_codon:yes gene_type:complete